MKHSFKGEWRGNCNENYGYEKLWIRKKDDITCIVQVRPVKYTHLGKVGGRREDTFISCCFHPVFWWGFMSCRGFLHLGAWGWASEARTPNRAASYISPGTVPSDRIPGLHSFKPQLPGLFCYWLFVLAVRIWT